MDKLTDKLKKCRWTDQGNPESWDRMLPLAEDRNVQWISTDSMNNGNDLKLLACLSCGCGIKVSNNCILSDNDLAVLVKNQMGPVRRLVQVMIKVKINEPKEKLYCSNNIKIFNLLPIIKNNPYVNSKTVKVSDIGPCKGYDIVVNIDVLRDITPDLKHIKRLFTKQNWTNTDADVSFIELSAHI